MEKKLFLFIDVEIHTASRYLIVLVLKVFSCSSIVERIVFDAKFTQMRHFYSLYVHQQPPDYNFNFLRDKIKFIDWSYVNSNPRLITSISHNRQLSSILQRPFCRLVGSDRLFTVHKNKFSYSIYKDSSK